MLAQDPPIKTMRKGITLAYSVIGCTYLMVAIAGLPLSLQNQLYCSYSNPDFSVQKQLALTSVCLMCRLLGVRESPLSPHTHSTLFHDIHPYSRIAIAAPHAFCSMVINAAGQRGAALPSQLARQPYVGHHRGQRCSNRPGGSHTSICMSLSS